MPIARLNHVVFYVRDARRSAAFYVRVLGFTVVIDDEDGRYAFLRAPGSANHHDVAVFTVGPDATPSLAGAGAVGTYHVAWEVPSLAELDEVRQRLLEAGALVGASDHAVNKSLYARDPDGLEFEVMWLTPSEQWGPEEHEAIIRPLDLDAEMRRFGRDTVSRS